MGVLEVKFTISKYKYAILFFFLLFIQKLQTQTIISTTNRDDPFGTLPDTTTNFIQLSNNADLCDIIYTTTTPPYIVRRLFNAITTSLNQTHIWDGQNDNGVNCAPGTYMAYIRLARQISYYTKLPPNNNFIDFCLPMDIAIDRWGNIYVIDNVLCIVEKFSPNGNFILKFGEPGSGDGQFTNPIGITVDTNCYIYVSDEIILL